MRTSTLILGALWTLACGTAAEPRIVTLGDPAAGQLKVLTGAEIMKQHGRGNLLQAVQILRPQFMSSRGLGRPVVYVDGLELVGGIDALATIPVESVSEVRYLTYESAVTRTGGGRGRGALMVTLAPRRGTVRVR